MTTTLITDDFDGDDDYDVVANVYRQKHHKRLTTTAMVLNQARIAKELSERRN